MVLMRCNSLGLLLLALLICAYCADCRPVPAGFKKLFKFNKKSKSKSNVGTSSEVGESSHSNVAQASELGRASPTNSHYTQSPTHQLSRTSSTSSDKSVKSKKGKGIVEEGSEVEKGFRRYPDEYGHDYAVTSWNHAPLDSSPTSHHLKMESQLKETPQEKIEKLEKELEKIRLEKAQAAPPPPPEELPQVRIDAIREMQNHVRQGAGRRRRNRSRQGDGSNLPPPRMQAPPRAVVSALTLGLLH